MSETMSHYLSFRVGTQWYGIDVDSVLDVLHFVALTELPAAGADILGLLTARDSIMPVIDLRLRFGLSIPDYRLDTPIITVHTGSGPVGLVVDDTENVESFITSRVVQYQRSELHYIGGVARLPDHLLLLLDAERLDAGAIR